MDLIKENELLRKRNKSLALELEELQSKYQELINQNQIQNKDNNLNQANFNDLQNKWNKELNELKRLKSEYQNLISELKLIKQCLVKSYKK